MKSKDTLKWFPSQLPKVRIILGDAVVEVAKQCRPINTRTLLDYIEGNIKAKAWLDNKELLQTAVSVLKENQDANGKI
ncbi:hypothetical protein FAS92_19600 [Salmonella enterica]|nr:hypothetical protein [Salmonella enterica]EAY3008018.1 hypothetical protein [Salmonella enterica subsp. enterica serovar Typhimurium]EBK0128819.1 hypothetical protein [Salmonella enterica]EIZ5249094.1 hypothetical protein [Salmonella enterica]EJB2416960.1 hypothetical protein [Salmonella enterica]